MNNLNEKIGFIGAGNMATALISGLINGNFSPTKIIASSPDKEHLQKLSEAFKICLLYTSPSPRDRTRSRMPSSA